MTEQERTPDMPADEAGDSGSLDAAALAFEKREQPAEVEAEQQAETEDEAAEDVDPDAEADEGEPDEDTDEPEAFAEVEYEGKTYKVPPELEKALLRQSDYSRKMNEVTGKEKVAAQRLEQAETLVQGAEKLASAIAEVQMIDARLKAYEGVDWATLRAENPAEFAARASELQMLRLHRQESVVKAQSVGQEVNQGKASALQAAREEMFRTLADGKTFKGWSDKKGEELTSYARESGIKLETLQSLTDAGLVVALEKARAFDALQKAKPSIKAKAQAVPQVLKPGAPRKANPQGDALAKLRKSNSLDDAAAAFLSRMR